MVVEEAKDRNIRIVQHGVFAPLRRWGVRWSLWPVHFVTSCCGVELAHSGACGYDMERLGALNYGIARQSNFIIIEGTITRKMARALRLVYEQMPDPKFVSLIGACGERGGLFWNSYNITLPHEIVPVDFFIPGCPVTPEGLIRGIRAVQEKIEGRGRTTIEFKCAELPREGGEARLVPSSPKFLAETPTVRIDVPREGELPERLKPLAEEEGVRVTAIGKNRVAIRTPAERLEEIALRLKELGFDHVKSVNIVDVPHERRMLVEYVVSSYSVRELMPVLVSLFAYVPRVSPGLQSLKHVWESADYCERELQDLFGVRFKGNPWQRRFILAPEVEAPLRKDFRLEEESYVLGEAPLAPKIEYPPEPLSYYLPVPDEVFEEAAKNDEFVLPIGPHHTGSGHLRVILRVKGDVIVDAIPDPGYVHRSMEKLAETKLYVQNIPLFERLSIADPVNINLGYVRTLEFALGVEPPERAKLIRTMLAELSRIGAFLYDAGIFSLFTGHSTGFMYTFSMREMLLELFVRMTGSRCTPSYVIPGGVRWDVSDEALKLTKNFTSAILHRLSKFESIFVNNPVLMERVKGVGVLTKEQAINVGIVGPFLRASGVEYDIRIAEPYEAYTELEWDVPVADDGDCLARFLLRLEEVRQSLNIVRQAVEALERTSGAVIAAEVLGEFKDAPDIRGLFFRTLGDICLPRGEFTCLTEAARGTLLFSILSDGESNLPYRVRVVTPSWMNLHGFMEAVKGQRLADFWAIYGSFGYFPPEADR
ncbi:MAG: NADH:ubiquinone oxidoreductase 49 kD subunit [Candidatus Alkanophagales archaeon MCA70_species_2]|nr:NADH:ubiquinone oxidoreductase 49 kD subunit [Candidatus Alkanophaga liquidiphilum]